MKKKDNPIVVVIHCLVYNHGSYLRDCLEGFVMQKTNFRFVAIVHDDASHDNSADIIREYESKYPNIINPIYETQNQFSKHDGSLARVMRKAIDATNAKYLALCEGDDFWTDPLKLQKQVDILEADTSLMACCTNSSLVDAQGKLIEGKFSRPVVKDNIQGKYSLRDFFEDNHTYPTASVIYRRTHIDEVRAKCDVMQNPYLGDWTQWIALLCFGDMYYLDDVTCAYRINPTSVTHSNVNSRRLGLAKANFKLLPAVASILPDEYQDIKDDLTKNTAWLWFNLGNAYKHLHQYFKMTACLIICGLKNPKLLYSKLNKRKNK